MTNFYGESSHAGELEFSPGILGYNSSTPSYNDQLLQGSVPGDVNQANLKSTENSDKHILLVTIPQHLSDAPLFNSIPTIEVDPVVINTIKETAAGYDGVFLPKIDNAPREEIVRRPPLQIIQQIAQPLKENSVIPANQQQSSHCKRKQQFKLTRDDGIVFTDCSQIQKKKVKLDDKTIDLTEPVSDIENSFVEKVECLGCNKMFCKLNSHKCKNLPTEVANNTAQPRAQPSLMLPKNRMEFKCNFCKKVFRHQITHARHMKSCFSAANLLFCDYCGRGFKSKPGLRKHCLKCLNSHAIVEVPALISMPAIELKEVFKEIKAESKITTRSASKTEKFKLLKRTRSSTAKMFKP